MYRGRLNWFVRIISRIRMSCTRIALVVPNCMVFGILQAILRWLRSVESVTPNLAIASGLTMRSVVLGSHWTG